MQGNIRNESCQYLTETFAQEIANDDGADEVDGPGEKTPTSDREAAENAADDNDVIEISSSRRTSGSLYGHAGSTENITESKEKFGSLERKQDVATETGLETTAVGGDGVANSGSAHDRPTPFDDARSWMACFSSFIICTFDLGIHNAFGVFFVALLDHFGSSGAETAWVASLSYGISYGVSPLATYASVRFGHRAVVAAGGVLCIIGLFASSFATNLGVLFLTYSVLFGVGTSFLYTIAILSNGQYFSRHRCLATGIVSAGGSFGTLVMTPFTQFLVSNYGWRKAWRLECVVLIVTVAASLSYRSRAQTPYSSARLPSSSVKTYILGCWVWEDRVFWIWTMATFLVYMGYYTPYVHMIKYAELNGASSADAAMLICYLGISTTVGRIIFGKLCDAIQSKRIYINQAALLTNGVSTLLLPLATNYAGMVAYVVFYGIADSVFITLLPVLTQDLVGPSRMIEAWGVMSAICSIAFTLGPPIAGWIFDAHQSYDVAFYFAGTLALIGALLLFLIPLTKRTTGSSRTGESSPKNADVTCFENPTYESKSVSVSESTAPSTLQMHTAPSVQDRFSIECFDVISLKSDDGEPAQDNHQEDLQSPANYPIEKSSYNNI